MTSEADITHKLWKAIKSDRTLMLGVADGAADSQPMTAMFDGEPGTGPLWIFSAADVDLVRAIEATGGAEGAAQFVAKGHDLFAALHGRLAVRIDRGVIDRLWNPFVAAWYKEGKNDPKLRLIRFELDRAHVWLNENAVFTAVKLLLGRDPKENYKDKTADVRL